MGHRVVKTAGTALRLTARPKSAGPSRLRRTTTKDPRIGELEREIAELQQRERDLRQRTEQALAVAAGIRTEDLRLGAAPSAVLSAISHDLRTPLNAVIGFASLMCSEIHGGLGHPKYRDYVKHIEASGQSILRSTCEILKLADLGVEKVVERDLGTAAR